MKRFFTITILLIGFLCDISHSQSQPSLFLKNFSSGFNHPSCIVNAGDNRLFVTEQAGTIRIIDSNGVVKSHPFLDITNKVISTGTEQGLLGIVFHPQYSMTGYFYVNYIGAGDSTHISRFSVSSSNPDSAVVSSEHRILTIFQPYTNHNGGDLHFGSDGFLYIGLGDGGSEGDPGNRAQDLFQLLGKLLRIDVDGADPYAIPPGNPYYGNPGARGEIWASGLRNPWRFSFDRFTNDLWISDVGQALWEEINFQSSLSTGRENYGWRCYEGMVPYNTTGCQSSDYYVYPVFSYPHDAGDPCDAVTGGYVYRGIKYPSMTGKYYFADYCTDKIWALSDSSGSLIALPQGSFAGNNFSTFGEDSGGELYIAGRTSGIVYQLVDTTFSVVNNIYDNKKIGIQPNPTTGKVRITLAEGMKINSALELVDAQGRSVLSFIPDSNAIDLDIGFLEPGFYFLFSKEHGKNLVGKIIKL
jgi:glucose/arabinose dehydrogenase